MMEELQQLEKHIDDFIKKTPIWHEKLKIIKSAPAVGKVTTRILLCQLPQLGRVSNKKITALVGLAPFNHDSGTFKGRRSILGGHGNSRFYVGKTAACGSGKDRRSRGPLIRELADDQPVVAAEGQVPAYESTADTLVEVGNHFLAILGFREHSLDGVCRELAAGDVNGHGQSS
jgi:hypothetical protein